MSKLQSAPRYLVSGANGFIGSALVAYLRDKRIPVTGVVRGAAGNNGFVQADAVGPDMDWSEILRGHEVVVHTAGRAHVLHNRGANSLAEFRLVNVDGTLTLARQAAEAGVRRFVFVSSIGVNGNINTRPFTAADQPNPAEPYAQSKWEAERGLMQLATETDMEFVIIRPPLVYGPGAPGNFGSLVRWIERGIPLPLGAINNKRSLVGIDNLVDLIIRCIDHPAAANHVFLAGDGEDLSTTELLRGVGKAMGKPARLVPVPAGLLQFGATLLGRKVMVQRLLGSLQVDISKTCELLDWKPPYTVEEGLRRCFEHSIDR